MYVHAHIDIYTRVTDSVNMFVIKMELMSYMKLWLHSDTAVIQGVIGMCAWHFLLYDGML